MKGKILLGLFLSAGLGISYADITVTIPENCQLETLNYYYAPIKQYASAKSRSERGLVADSVAFQNHKAVINIPTEADSYLYGLSIKDNNATLFVTPGENIDLNVTSCNPFNYNLSGSELADGINQLNALSSPLEEKIQALYASGQPSDEELEELSGQYLSLQKNFINSNPGNPAVAVALMNLDGEDFITVYESLGNQLNESILYPLVAQQYEREKKGVEMDKRQQDLQSGEIEAPGFTLKNLEGKDVSLSDFRGKWVILDFWGSWCPWCIKGFPELKEAYEKYKDNLVIIGVDCKESEADWKAGVEKYQLPWVNVYNPDNTTLLSDYGVQGFPTKAIIDPEGKIRNITVGHNPAFFTALTELLGK